MTDFMKISLCMIVKNEGPVLARCLDSVRGIFDEIIIADTGSTDGTKQIAGGYTPFVYDFAWQDDFALARNFAFSKATGDYLAWLDADDFVSPENAQKFPTLRAELERELPDMVMCPYDTAFDENGNHLSSFYRERFFKREAEFQWQGRVHECIAPRGKILRSDFRIFHLGSKKERGMRNLHIYQKWAGEEKLSARDLFYYGRELYYHRLYTEAIAVLEEMLCGEGWYVNKIEACKILSYCHGARDDGENAKRALFRSFVYGEPRAFICCEIAAIFKKETNLKEAAFWYETARACRDHSAEGDFEEPNARTLVPLLELVCCYYALGEPKRAVECHKETERLFPNHSAVIFNRNFFESKKLL